MDSSSVQNQLQKSHKINYLPAPSIVVYLQVPWPVGQEQQAFHTHMCFFFFLYIIWQIAFRCITTTLCTGVGNPLCKTL